MIDEKDIYEIAAVIALVIILALFMTVLALLQNLMDRGYKRKCVDAFLERIENEIECRKEEQVAYVESLRFASGWTLLDLSPEDMHIIRSQLDYLESIRPKLKMYGILAEHADRCDFDEHSDYYLISGALDDLVSYYDEKLDAAQSRMEPDEPTPDEVEALEGAEENIRQNGTISHNDVEWE